MKALVATRYAPFCLAVKNGRFSTRQLSHAFGIINDTTLVITATDGIVEGFIFYIKLTVIYPTF